MIESILAWASEHRDQALWLVPLLAFMETCVGIGLFVPSLMLVVVTSVFYANDWANPVSYTHLTLPTIYSV